MTFIRFCWCQTFALLTSPVSGLRTLQQQCRQKLRGKWLHIRTSEAKIITVLSSCFLCFSILTLRLCVASKQSYYTGIADSRGCFDSARAWVSSRCPSHRLSNRCASAWHAIQTVSEVRTHLAALPCTWQFAARLTEKPLCSFLHLTMLGCSTLKTKYPTWYLPANHSDSQGFASTLDAHLTNQPNLKRSQWCLVKICEEYACMLHTSTPAKENHQGETIEASH